jgi:hypothetical protein
MNPSTDIEISTSTEATIHLLAFEGLPAGPMRTFRFTYDDGRIRLTHRL